MFKIYKFKDFKNHSVNENLDKSKKMLKDRVLLRTAVDELDLLKGEIANQIKYGERKGVTINDFSDSEKSLINSKIRELKLTPEQIKEIESDSELKKVRELKISVKIFEGGVDTGREKVYQLDKDNIGWLSNFVYFYFYEERTIEDLEFVYEKLINNKAHLNNLTIKKDGIYTKVIFDANFINPNVKNNYELLTDGLDVLTNYLKVKSIVDRLTPILKTSFSTISEINMTKLINIAEGFTKVTKEDFDAFFGSMRLDTREFKQNGDINPSYNKVVFMSTIPRYQTIDEFIKAAQQHLDAVELSKIEFVEGETPEQTRKRAVTFRYSTFVKQVENCNKKFGVMGADIIYPENPWEGGYSERGILIIEVRSFQANVFLNSHTNHCIKDRMGDWEFYIASHNNKQYYIYDFNVALTSNNSTYGITVEPGMDNIRACHDRIDAALSLREFKRVLRKFQEDYDINEDLWKFFLPMSTFEIERKERSKEANRKITDPNISLEQIRNYVMNDGADINRNEGAALQNAIIENDYDKIKGILELGASPNLRKKSDSALSNASDLNVLKLLIDYGAEMTGEVFNNVVFKPESLEHCLKAGLDPAFGINLPLRKIIIGSKDVDDVDIYESFLFIMQYMKKVYGSDKMIEVLNSRNYLILSQCVEFGRYQILEYLEKIGIFNKMDDKSVERLFSWLRMSKASDDATKKKIYDFLKNHTGVEPSFTL